MFNHGARRYISIRFGFVYEYLVSSRFTLSNGGASRSHLAFYDFVVSRTSEVRIHRALAEYEYDRQRYTYRNDVRVCRSFKRSSASG